MSSISKLDFLKKYASPTQNINQKNDSQKQMQSSYQKQVQFIDREIDCRKQSLDEDDSQDNIEDEKPILVECSELINLTQEQKNILLQNGQITKGQLQQDQNKVKRQQSGQWIRDPEPPNKKNNILDKIQNLVEIHSTKSNSKNGSDKSSSPSPNHRVLKRKRHDSTSGDDDNNENAKDQKDDEVKEQKYKKLFSQALDIPNNEGDQLTNQKQQQSDNDSDISVERRRGRKRRDSSEEPEKDNKQNNEKQQNSQQQHQPIQFSLNLSKLQNNKTIYRDITGKKIDPNTQLAKQSKKEELLKKNMEQINKWSKGLIQKQEQDNLKQEIKNISKESFAQYSLSKEAELDMIKKVRFGDTMAKLISEDDEKLQAQKLKQLQNQNIPLKPRLKCKFPGIPNRFGILPGHLWDGVDRGNGFEAKYFQMSNTRIANQQIAHEAAMIDL